MTRRIFFKAVSLNALIILFISAAIYAGNYPFPIDRNYPNGIRISTYNANDIQAKYNTWKSTYVVAASPGQRVISPEPISGANNRTVSEGIAYGMLLAVYFDDKTLFDNLWAFKEARSSAKASRLMPWIIENNGTTIIDPNSASDADFDIAFALLMAEQQWGNTPTNYGSLALTEIQRCRLNDIASADYHVKPGDAWDNWSYPSYYFPAFFRVFAEVDNAAFWNNVVAKCYTNINNNNNDTSGLVGEICNSDGTRRTDNPCGSGCDGRKYKYNSCRVPFRYATDHVWHGASVSNPGSTETGLLAGFFNGITASNVVDGYYISNNAQDDPPRYNNAAFVGPAGCSLMYSSTYSSKLTEYFNRTNSFSVTEAYYNGSLQLLSLLLMTGNFHNLRTLGGPIPTRTSTPVPSGQLLDDFEDYTPPARNTQNNWGGFWFTVADAPGGVCASVSPTAGGHVTMTAGGAYAGSNWHLRITGNKCAAVAPNYPSVGVGTELVQNATALGLSVDVRPFQTAGGGFRFWVKGSGTAVYKMTLVPKDRATLFPSWDLYQYVFTPPATWTQMVIPFTDFMLPAWSSNTTTLATVLSQLQQIQWQNGVDTAMTIDLALDDVEFYPYLWTPTPNPTATSTQSATRTQSPTVTPTFGPSEMLDTCEDGNGTNNWGGLWYTYNDNAAPNNGTSYVVPIPGAAFNMTAGGVTGSTAYASRITGTVTSAYMYGYIGVGTQTNPNAGTNVGMNCTGFTGIRFWAKGDGGQYDVKLIPTTAVVTGNDNYKFTFAATTTWQQYQIPFAAFTQEGWGTAVTRAAVLTVLKSIEWQTINNPWASIELWLDNIEMYPNQNWTPTRTNTSTPSQTFTVSNTPTRTNTFTASQTSTSTRTNTYTNTATNTGTQTYTNTPSSTASRTNTPSQTNTNVPPTNTNTPTESGTPTFSRTATNTATSSSTPSSTATRTYTATPSETGTATFSRTATNTATNTVTRTFTNTATNTGTPTNTGTFTNTPTETDTWDPALDTQTFTQTFTRTQTFTVTHTPTRTFTNTQTFTNTRTDTNTPTETGTPTYTRTGTNTQTPTNTRTATNTATDTGTVTNTATHTNTLPPGADTFTQTNTPQNTATNTSTTVFTPTNSNTALFTATNTDTVSIPPTNTATTTLSVTAQAPSATTITLGNGSDIITQGFTSSLATTSVEIRLYDATGTTYIKTLYSDTNARSAGSNSVMFADETAFSGVAAGTYTYRIQMSDGVQTSLSAPTSAITVVMAPTPSSTQTLPPGVDTFTQTNTPQNTATNTFTNIPTPTNTPTTALSVTISAPSQTAITIGDTSVVITLYFTTSLPTNNLEVRLYDAAGTALVRSLYTDNFTRGAGSNNVMFVDETVFAGLAAGTYTYRFFMTDGIQTTLSAPSSQITVSVAAPTPSVTSTYTAVFTSTATNTFTYTYTNTPVFTNTNTPQPTSTNTPLATATATPNEFKFDGPTVPYPNPVNIEKYQEIYFKINLTQTDVDKVSLRIYTTSMRLIREVLYSETAAQIIAKGGIIRYPTKDLKNIGLGSYYYIVIAEKKGQTAKSKVDKIVILK